MKKIILEEIENMKYLLGYKRGVVISEQETQPIVNQDDDNSLNPKVVAGTTPPVAGTTTPPAATTPAATTPPAAATPIKIGVKYPSIMELQNLLNTKFQTGLTPDGKYGPKTAASILASLSKTSTTTNTTPVNTVVGGDASSEAIKKTAEANASTGVASNDTPAVQNTQQNSNSSNFDEVNPNEFT